MIKKISKKLFMILILVSLLFVFSFSGCQTSAAEAEATAAEAEATEAEATAAEAEVVAETKDVYVWASVLINLPLFIDAFVGMDRAEEVFGVEYKIIGPTENDISAMISAMEAEIPLKPAGMLVVGWDAALADTINKVLDSGIPVVTVDADVPASNRIGFFGTGNYSAGVESAKRMAELIDEKGEVAIAAYPTLSNVTERVRGFREYITKNYPDIKIVAEIDTQEDSSATANAIAAVIQGNPNIKGIVGFNAPAGTGICAAVRESGKEGEIAVGMMDRDEATLDLIKDGIATYTVVQRLALMHYLSIELLYNYNHGNLPFETVDNRANDIPLPVNVDTGAIIVDKSNYEYFYHK